MSRPGPETDISVLVGQVLRSNRRQDRPATRGEALVGRERIEKEKLC